jgi:hypothetical protein
MLKLYSLAQQTLNLLSTSPVMVRLSQSVCSIYYICLRSSKNALTLPDNPLSISHISSNTAGFQCTFNGIDQSVTTVNGAETVDVGPPQTQLKGSCSAQGSDSTPPPPPPANDPAEDIVDVTFIGAADAQFHQSFTVDGQSVSISTSIYIYLVSKQRALT